MRSHLELWTAFDCETVAIADATDYLEPVSAPSNYKDPEKIAAYIEDAAKRQREKAALDVDLARVVALAYQTNDMAQPEVLLAKTEADERDALTTFWRTVHSNIGPVVGFSIRTYDLPLLIRRSQLLDVPYPVINMDRYRSSEMVDLYDVLTFNGTIDGKKLITYCKRFGIALGGDVTGAEIAECVSKGDWTALAAHAYTDVCRVVALARAIGAIYVPSTELDPNVVFGQEVV